MASRPIPVQGQHIARRFVFTGKKIIVVGIYALQWSRVLIPEVKAARVNAARVNTGRVQRSCHAGPRLYRVIFGQPDDHVILMC